MESVKKIIPFLLVAIVFAVGGYFIGHNGTSDQGASLYNAAATKLDSRVVTGTTVAGGFPVWLCSLIGGVEGVVTDMAGTHHYCSFALIPASDGMLVSSASASFSSTCASLGGEVNKDKKSDCAISSPDKLQSALLKSSPNTGLSMINKGTTKNPAGLAGSQLFWCWLFSGNVHDDHGTIVCTLAITAKIPTSQIK